MKMIYIFFVLPCGYSVCYGHLTSQDESFNCFVCQDHMIEKQSCFRMKKNEKKLEKVLFFSVKDSILDLCNQIDEIDSGCFTTNYLSKVINKIDLKREILKDYFIKQIDDYHESLINKIKEHESEFIDSFKNDQDKVNSEDVRKDLNIFLQNVSEDDLFDLKIHNEALFDLREKYLNKFSKNLQNFKDIDFYEGQENQNIKIPQMFGFLRSKNEALIVKEPAFKPKENKNLSNNFNFLCKFGLAKFEISSNGQIISTSFTKPSNVLIIDPVTGHTCELNGKNPIEFLFKTKNDEILTIDSEFQINLWLNGECEKNFCLVRKKIIRADLIEDKIVTITEDFFVTVIKYYNGKILYHYYINTNNDPNIKIASVLSDYIIINMYNGFCKLNIISGNEEKNLQYHSYGEPPTIERVNKNEFVFGSSTGELCIWNSDLSVKLEKKCHSSAISGIMLCEDGNIVSISSQDGIIKIWNCEDLSLIHQSSMKNLIFAKLLSCGKLLCVASGQKAYITD